jgi:hypothetical protein
VDINPHFARGSWVKKDEKEVYAIFWGKHSAQQSFPGGESDRYALYSKLQEKLYQMLNKNKSQNF